MEQTFGYFPDLYTRWGSTLAQTHFGETMIAEAGRRQSMNFGPQKLRVFTAQFIDEPPVGSGWTNAQLRARIVAFNDARGGQHGQAFNFWNPNPTYIDYASPAACGTASAQSSFITNWRLTNSIGGVSGTLYDVRVAGVSQAFTVRHLLPSPRSFASLRFNGASGFVTCGTQTSLRATGDQAIGAWVWRATATAAVIAGNATFNASGAQLEITAGGVLRFVTNQAGAQVIATCSGTTIPLQTWTHVFAVKSGTTVTFYTNGVANGAAQTGITNPIVATAAFLIGAGAVAVFSDAMIAHVRYYASAPSAGEILNICNGVGTPSSNLKGWWRLEEGYGTAAADISGSSGNGGTVTGTAPWVAGHEEIVFSSGAQTGAVTIVIYGRELMVCGFGSEPLSQSFIVNGSETTAAFPIVIMERL